MSWSRWYAVRSYAKASLWIVPFLAVVVEQILLHLSLAIDSTARWLPEWPFTAAATTAALQTIISLMLSFIVFTFGSLLVAIQVASGQLTPRIIATTLLRNNTIRCTVGLFVVTMLFALGAMNRVGEDVPRLTVWLAMLLGGISLAGGRGSIVGTVLGALIFGVIISGFTFLKLDAYYQERVKGAIIVGAVVLDQWRQRRRSLRG